MLAVERKLLYAKFMDEDDFTLPQKILLFLEENGKVLYETLYHPSRMAYHYDEMRDRIGRQAFYNAVRRMKKAGLIAEKNKHFKITEKGKLKIRWLRPQSETWDGKWRIVIFDIPEKKRDLRNFFRSRLKELGFRFLQESVWISPYNIADKVEDLINQSKAGRYVHYLVVEEIDNKNILMKLFHLKRQYNKSRSVESILLAHTKSPKSKPLTSLATSKSGASAHLSPISNSPKIMCYDSNMKPVSKEIPPQYNPKQTEDRIYELWLQSNAFQPKVDDNQKPFVIVIPPPNVTGSLHMGHALNNTIQDILIRRSRMKGVPTLWIPGTDHAGIATQNVVEKVLAKEGKNRNDLGRKDFEKRVWQHVDQYGHIIIDQLKRMGCSCDWSRQRYTMDEGYIEAVNTAFKHYFDKGLIYQGERVINWCVRCQTALSDIELEHREVNGKLWYIKYPLAENSKSQTLNSKQITNSKSQIQNYITVATTRPETMLGDTAVAVNPKDKRYENLIGKTVILPLVNREIPIIADDAVDMKFGTGAVKVTPAHDMNDFEIWMRNKEKIGKPIRIINETGKIAHPVCSYDGQKTTEARENIVKDLEAAGLIEKTPDYTHEVPYCYRCGRQVEQLISKQWFLKMSELIKPAIEAIEKDEIQITPLRWKKVYLDWMKNIRDWCISRQIWWGHRLPVYQREEARNPKSEILNKSQILNSKNSENSDSLEIRNEGLKADLEIYVGSNPPAGYVQSPDVLDTWFSSALWSFATLGWPQEKRNVIASEAKQSTNKKIAASSLTPRNDTISDLAYFYPTSVLSTARDINMLWVVRMIFSGYEFMGQKPFETVYVHPTVFNIEGKRMSKSLGTGLDPLQLIEKYGADAIRFGLTYINTGTQDIKFDENAILAGQKFANKLWNINRFVLQQFGNSKFETLNSKQIPNPKSEIDKKILQSLNHLITSYNHNLDEFKFGQAAHDLYDFVWHDFADQYLEQAKTQMENVEYRINTTEILIFVLRTSLLLLHPIMPFITEKIWQILKENQIVENNLIIASWPKEK